MILKCLVAGLMLSGSLIAADQPSSDDVAQKAFREFSNQDFPAAERDFRQLVKQDPSNLSLLFYLGQTLFREQQYAEAAVFYQRARDIEKPGQLTSVLHRILTDQLVMSYGISGNLKKAEDLVREAIAKDPDYPLNYYNLACVAAEEGHKQEALANLQRAYDHKANIIAGEQMPDPTADPSFQKYSNDPDFLALVKKLGYK